MLDGIFDKICLVLCGVLVLLGLYTWHLHSELTNCRNEQAGATVVGQAQEANTKKENKESKENKGEVENEYGKIITDMHIDAERLRNKIANSRILPRTPQICTGATERETIDWPLIDQAIRTYRQAVRGLVVEGSEAVAALNAAKMWITKETE